MRKITAIILTAAIFMNVSVVNLHAQQTTEHNPVIVEDNYYPSDTYRIVRGRNGYDKITVNGREHHKQPVQSAKEVMRLPIALDLYEIDCIFLMPSEINGIVMDIPYNYYSPLASSAKYYQMLLYNGWELAYYNASSLCVQIGLINSSGITCRLLIYEDYLKVYCSLM